jgi:hypothetical protein
MTNPAGPVELIASITAMLSNPANRCCIARNKSCSPSAPMGIVRLIFLSSDWTSQNKSGANGPSDVVTILTAPISSQPTWELAPDGSFTRMTWSSKWTATRECDPDRPGSGVVTGCRRFLSHSSIAHRSVEAPKRRPAIGAIDDTSSPKTIARRYLARKAATGKIHRVFQIKKRPAVEPGALPVQTEVRLAAAAATTAFAAWRRAVVVGFFRLAFGARNFGARGLINDLH